MNQSKLIHQPGASSQISYSAGRWNRPTITGLEADLAYFHARLEFVGTPTTINQKIQLVVFKSLVQSTQRVLNHLQHKT